MVIKYYLLIIFLIVFVSSNAQYPYSALTVDDGLPVNSAWTITQDHMGCIWFGTFDGLCKYDGYSLQVFKNNPANPQSISENSIKDIYVAGDNNLWIAHNDGISFYNQSISKFENIFSYTKKNNLDVINRVIGEDNQGNIWTWVYKEGLLVFNINTRKIIAKYGSPEFIDHMCITGKFSNDGNIYLSLSEIGIYTFNMADKLFNSVYDTRSGSFEFTENEDILLSGLGNSLLIINKKQEILHEFFISPGDLLNTKSLFYIACFQSYKPNMFFVGTSEGIFLLDLNKNTFERFVFSGNKNENYSLGDCLFKDRSGNLWAGTHADGIVKILVNSRKFNLLKPHDKDKTIVKAINKGNKNVFVGYFEGGLDIYNTEHFLIDHIDTKNTNIPSNSFFAVMEISQNTLLTSFFNSHDIGIINWETKKYTSLLPQLNKAHPDFLALGYYSNFIIRADEHHYIFNRDEYLFNLYEKDGQIDISKYDSIEGAKITCAFIDKSKTIWVGSFNGVYFKKENNWKKVELPVSVHVKCIAQQMDGSIWVGGDHGVFVLNASGEFINWFNENNKLLNEYVYAILPEKDGNMWLSSNKGIAFYDEEKQSFKNFNKTDGMQSNEFNTGAYYKEENGFYYLGGVNGVNYFKPEQIIDNVTKPITQITSVLVNDNLIESDTNFSYLKHLSLNYHLNTISIHYVGCEFTNQTLNKYQYRLTGVDADWVNAGIQRQVRYVNLKPGKYTFEVKSCNNDGVWNEEPAAIFIEIIPPFWQTIWFRILSAISIISLSIFIGMKLNKWRTTKRNRKLEMQKKLQEERERISRDLHDNVGAQLSFINSNIDWIVNPLKEFSKNEEKERLITVSETAQHIMSNLRETIWALNKKLIDTENLSDKLKEYFQKQLQFKNEIGLNITEEIKYNIKLNPSVALHIFRIGQEILNNCIKYAQASKIDLTIKTNAVGDFNMIIKDNGIGFDKETILIAEHFGLENMKARTEEMNGQLTIESSKENGTIISLFLSHLHILHL